jgi:quercetin dioxygenase-like cupin family protein
VPRVISAPVSIPVPGGKVIDEYAGVASTGGSAVSVARMSAPPGWSEPPQTPAFSELTVVLAGAVVVHCQGHRYEVTAGSAFLAEPGETVQYEVGPQGAQYVAVCWPAFTEQAARRQEDQ